MHRLGELAPAQQVVGQGGLEAGVRSAVSVREATVLGLRRLPVRDGIEAHLPTTVTGV